MSEADELKEYALASIDWGLWDARDKCWMGNAQGPLRYNDRMLARVAATIATEMFGRIIRPMLLPGKPYILKDEVTSRFDGAEAIQRIENRVVS